MRTLLLASLLSGVAAWSAADIYADPPADEAGAATAAEEKEAATEEARPDEDRPRPPRDGDRPRGEPGRRRGPDGERRGPGDRGPDGRGPDGERPFGPPGGRFGGPRDEFAPPPLIRALDADGDHEISAEEIAGAADALKSLDKNSDGKLSPDELRPEFAGRGPGDGERGPPRDGERRGPRFDGPRDGDGPPREGREERGFRGRDGDQPPPEGREGRGPGFGRRGDGPPLEGRDGEGRGRRGPEGREEARRHGRGHGERGFARPRPPEDRAEGERDPKCDEKKESESKPAEASDTQA